MNTNRLEAFSDGVLAIIITIMVLGLHTPESAGWNALIQKIPNFLSYIASFIYVGIYWNNHHHLFQITEKVNGRILWANLHLLFWLSLIPFTTSWIADYYESTLPVLAYGAVLLLSAISYLILQNQIISYHGVNSTVRQAIGRDRKGKLSMVLYVAGIVTSPFSTWLAISCYLTVAVMWLIPDRRIERQA